MKIHQITALLCGTAILGIIAANGRKLTTISNDSYMVHEPLSDPIMDFYIILAVALLIYGLIPWHKFTRGNR
jgi:hypothetical protein